MLRALSPRGGRTADHRSIDAVALHGLRPAELCLFARYLAPDDPTGPAELHAWPTVGRAEGGRDEHQWDHATVKFIAKSKIGGRLHNLHEVSRFVWESGHWYCVDGVVG